MDLHGEIFTHQKCHKGVYESKQLRICSRGVTGLISMGSGLRNLHIISNVSVTRVTNKRCYVFCSSTKLIHAPKVPWRHHANEAVVNAGYMTSSALSFSFIASCLLYLVSSFVQILCPFPCRESNPVLIAEPPYIHYTAVMFQC